MALLDIHADELNKRISEVKRTVQELTQMVNLMDGNYDSKVAEIKSMEMKRDNLKAELDSSTNKGNAILQEATEKAADISKEAKRVMGDAQASKADAEKYLIDAQKKQKEADSILAQAKQTQKEADLAWHQIEERRKKIMEAVK